MAVGRMSTKTVLQLINTKLSKIAEIIYGNRNVLGGTNGTDSETKPAIIAVLVLANEKLKKLKCQRNIKQLYKYRFAMFVLIRKIC